MRTVRLGAAGFTLIEAVIALGVMSLLIGIGIPRMSDWLMVRKAASAGQFYRDGFQFARAQAVSHNSASRLSLVDNGANRQMDWRVDICFPTPSVPCDDESGVWSTTTSVADGDPNGAAGYRSVQRSAGALPGSDVMAQTLAPSGATDVYFTPLGWVDGNVAPRLTRITLAPSLARQGSFPRQAIVLTLAGTAALCAPDAAAHDSRGCPP